MFDAEYFRSTLPVHAKADEGDSTVEVHLVNGQSHRIRSVADVTDGYVVLDVHQRRAEATGAKTHWRGDAAAEGSGGDGETVRAVIAYESIAQVVIIPSESAATTRIGFGAR